MPVLKTKVGTDWVPLVAGRDGAQGPPGPASPHEGSNIAVGVRQYGAVGDGTTDDTAAIQAAINAAGPYGFLDAEAGTYKVTGNLGMDFWRARKDGPGVITDAAGNQFRISPRDDTDVNTIWVNGGTGSDANDGISPSRPLKTLAGLAAVFAAMGDMLRGTWIIRLSGTIVGGQRFQNLPATKLFLSFRGDGDAPGIGMAKTRPATWIERTPGDATDRFGMRFEEAEGSRIELVNLGFRGFNAAAGDMGWLIKSGGFLRAWNCWTENCDIGSGYVGSVGFSELYGEHIGYKTSGSRCQYNSSGTWTGVKFRGGPNAFEGVHVSRQSVCHVDDCVIENHTTWGAWSDMSTRVSYVRPTVRNSGSAGIRAQGSSDIQIDGTPAFENNGAQHVSIRGTARHATEEGIFAIPEHLADSRFFSARTTALASDRTFKSWRVGTGARVSVRAYGDTAGTLAVAGGLDFGTVAVPAGNWVVDIVAQCTGGAAWTITRQVNGGAPTYGTATSSGDIKPVFTPAGGARLRGIEVRVGG